MGDLEIGTEQLPRHVAIIMDGNGRWAEARGLERNAGHREGIESVRAVVRRAHDLGVEVEFPEDALERGIDKTYGIETRINLGLRPQKVSMVSSFQATAVISSMILLLLPMVEHLTRIGCCKPTPRLRRALICCGLSVRAALRI